MGFKKLCTALCIAHFHAVPQISSVTPSKGSTKGATKLTIQGSGFADSAFSTDGDSSGQGNKVFLYNDKYQFECPIGKDSQTSIECNTPNNMDVTEELTVKVQSNGVTSLSSNHKFTPSDDHTPKIDWLHPQVMEPNGLLTQHGDLYTRLYTTNQANFPDSPYACQNDCTVIRIWHRGSQCHLFNNTDPLNESDAIYGYSMDNEGRTSPEGKFTCRMSGGYVGNQNFTFIIDQDYGRSKTLKSIRKIAHNDVVYDLQTYAVVNSLSVAESGVNGGAKLTIAGRWFDGTPENDGGFRTKVSVGGQICEIESINDHEVVCTIPPGSDTASDGKTWYPGGRGINMIMFDNQDSTSLDDLMAMDDTSSSSVKHYNSEFKLSSSNFSAATSPGSYARGYFRPGRSSKFLFNDVGGVYFGADPDSEDITVQSGNFSTDLVDLVAGELYPIVWHRSDTSDAVFKFEQLSTSIPVGLVDASVPEKHQLSIQVENENEVQQITFNNVPASTTYNLDQVVCLSCPVDVTCKTKVKIYGHTTVEITVNDQFITNLQSLLSSSAFAPGIVPNSETCAIGFVTLKDVVTFVESSSELTITRSDYVAGDQTASISGYLPLLNNVAPLAPITTHTNNDVLDFSSTLSETYCPDFFTSQKRGLNSHYYQTFENTDDNGNACNWSVDYENSYCGRASSKNQHTLFNAGHHGASSEDCTKDGDGNWNTKDVFMPTQYKYLCFNYKGAVGSGFNIRYRVYGKPGEASYIKRNHWTGSEVDTSLENQNIWKHYCIDLSEKAAWWQENRDTEPTIMLQIENIWWSQNGGDFWFDNIQISSSLPDELTLTQAESERVEVTIPATKAITVDGENNVFNVTFQPAFCGSPYPEFSFAALEASISGNIVTYTHSSWPADANIQVERLTAASPRLSGVLNFELPGRPVISLDVHSMKVQQYEDAFKADNIGVEIETSTWQCHNKVFTVTFKNPGGYYGLATLDDSAVIGNGLTIDYTQEQRGRLDVNPAGADWFVTAHKKPQVVVSVNGFPAKCDDDSGSVDLDLCSFEYKQSTTPTVTGVNPTTSGADGATVITVTGTNLDGVDRMVPTCDTITQVSDTEIQCTISTDAVGGTYNVLAFHPTRGQASNDANVQFTVTASVSSINPTSGSIAGGQKITLTGSALSSDATVTINGITCAVESGSSTEIICTAGGLGTENLASTILVNGVSQTPTFDYANADTVVFSSISGFTGDVAGGEIVTVSGSNIARPMESWLEASNGDKTTIVFDTISDSQVTFVSPALAPGSYSLKVHRRRWGSADVSALSSFDYSLVVTGATTTSGSIWGGVTTTVQGSGFSESTIISIGDNKCEATSVSATEIECKVPSSTKTIHLKPNNDFSRSVQWSASGLNSWQIMSANAGMQELQVGDSVLFTWDFTSEAGDYKMKICESEGPGNELCSATSSFNSGEKTASGQFKYTFNQEGMVHFTSGCVNSACTQKLFGTITVSAHSSSISAPISARLSTNSEIVSTGSVNFEYTDAAAITVTGISAAENQVLSSETFDITGTGFDGNTVATVGSNTCEISNLSATSFSCRIPASEEPAIGVYEPLVVSNPSGEAIMKFGTAQESMVLLKPVVTDMTPTEGSVAGGTKITILGYGLDTPDLSVKFGTEDCDLVSNNYGEYICLTPETAVQATDSAKELVISTATMIWDTSSMNPVFNYTLASTPTIIGRDFDSSAMTAGSNIWVGIENWSGQGMEIKCGDTACNQNFHSQDPIPEPDVEGSRRKREAQGDYSLWCEFSESPVAPRQLCTFRDTIFGYPLFHERVGAPIYIDVAQSLADSDPIVPVSGSVAGGQLITINGAGFGPDVTVSINGQTIIPESVSLTEIVFTTPSESTGARKKRSVTNVQVLNGDGSNFGDPVEFTFDSSITPTVTSVTPVSAVSGETITLTGTNFGSDASKISVLLSGDVCTVTAVTDVSIECTLPNRTGGSVTISVIHADIGAATVTASFEYTYIITDVNPKTMTVVGGVVITVSGEGFANSATVQFCDADVSATISTQEITFIAPHAVDLTQTSTCKVKVINDGQAAVESEDVTYDFDGTPAVTSVEPARGGSMGGTIITVHGSGFDPVSDWSVKIGSTDCTMMLSDSSTSALVCETGEYDQVSERNSLVKVYSSSGQALNQAGTFWYIDRWNSEFTWNGEDPPRDDELVFLTQGQTIMIDGTTNNVKLLLVDGATVIFDEDQDCHLNAQNILVTNGGEIIAGTKEQPYTGKLTIEMHGHPRSLELPIYGTKTLAVREGTLSLHGQHKTPTWTRLAQTAQSGANQIVVQQSVNWQVGDRIVLPTTGHLNSQNENEVHIISAVSVDGLTITLEENLEYTHLGETATLRNGKTLEMRGEVAVLTRNIVFKGNNDPQWNDPIEACPDGFDTGEFAVQTCFQGRFGDEVGSNQFGGAIMLHPEKPGDENEPSKAVALLEQIEATFVGQAFRLARYPIHFDFVGNANNSYVRGIAVHEGFNRAIVIHHTDYLDVMYNTVWNIMGGAVFIEDGIERYNNLFYNFVGFVKSSTALINDDITPASMWITNPQNNIAHNSIGGSTHFGIWYRMHHHPDAASFTPDVCQDMEPLGYFANNTVHSVGWFGLWIFENFWPHDDGCAMSNPVPAKLEGYRGWRMNKGAEFFEVGAIQASDFIIAETAFSGVEWKRVYGVHWDNEASPWLKNSTISARTEFYLGEDLIKEQTAIIMPAASGVLIENVDIIDYGHRPGSHGVEGTLITCVCAKGCGGFEWRFKGINWYNTTTRLHGRWLHDFRLYDMDGTFGGPDQVTGAQPNGNHRGTAGSRYYVNWPGVYDAPNMGCELQENTDMFTVNGGLSGITICPPSSDDTVRLAMNEIYPPDLSFQDISILRDGQEAATPFREIAPTHGEGWQFSTPINKPIRMLIPNQPAKTNFSLAISLYDLKQGDHLIIEHELAIQPDQIRIMDWNPVAQDAPLDANSPYNSYYWNNDTKIMQYIVKWPESSRKKRDKSFGLMQSDIKVFHIRPTFNKCYFEDCIVPEPSVSLPVSLSGRPENAMFTSQISWVDGPTTSFGNVKIMTTSNSRRKKRSVLADGDSIMIKADEWIVIDNDLPTLKNVVVLGGLEFNTTTIFKANSVLVYGGTLTATIDTDTTRTEEFVMEFQGDKDDVQLEAGMGNMLGSKGLACYGRCQFIGQAPTNSWVKLSATANAGDTLLQVAGDIMDWEIGKKILLTSTSQDMTQVEEKTIDSINGQVITLDSPLVYKHNGEATDGLDSLVGEVAYLYRPIQFRSVDENPADGYGMRIVAGQTLALHPETGIFTSFGGNIDFQGVSISNAGQSAFNSIEEPRWAVQWKDGQAGTDDQRQSLRDSVVYNTFTTAVGILNNPGVTLDNNVIYRSGHSGVFVDAESSTIENNLVVNNQYWACIQENQFGNELEVIDDKWPAAFQLDKAGNGLNNTFNNNRVAGSAVTGISTLGHACDQDPSTFYSGNTVRGAFLGQIWQNLAVDETQNRCNILDGLDISNSMEFGIHVIVNGGAKVTVQNIKVANSNSANLFGNTVGPENTSPPHYPFDSQVVFKDGISVGQTNGFSCETDRYSTSTEFFCKALNNFIGHPKHHFSGARVGFIGSSLDAPEMPGAWDHFMEGPPKTRGSTLFSNIIFKDIGESCDSSGAQLIEFNPAGYVDNVQMAAFEQVTKTNVAVITSYPVPGTGNISPAKCIDMECDNETGQLIVDLDGSLTGDGTGRGAILPRREFGWDDPNEASRGLGDYRIPKTALTELDGTRIPTEDIMPQKGRIRNDAACNFEADVNAYICTGPEAYEYMYLMIENMDHDTRERRLSPTMVWTHADSKQPGTVDLYNGPARGGWGERLGLWHTTVAADTTVEVHFTGSPPKHARFQLQGGKKAGGKILLKMYTPIPQQIELRKVTHDGTDTETVVAHTSDDTSIPGNEGKIQTDFIPTLSDAPGTNYHWRDGQLFNFIIDDGEFAYDLHVTDQVIMAFGFPPVPLADFFQDKLQENLANFFGVDPSKIRVVKVIKETSKKRQTENVIGVETEITADSSNSGQIANSVTTTTRNIATGDTTDLVQIFADNPNVQATQVTVTKVVNIPPSDTNSAQWEAYTQSITSKIESGKSTDIGCQVTQVGEIFLDWVPSSSYAEAEVISNHPVVKFKDPSGNLMSTVGCAENNDIWQVKAELVNGDGTQVVMGTTQVSVVQGVATFADLKINRKSSNDDQNYQIKFTVVDSASLTQTSANFKISKRVLSIAVSTPASVAHGSDLVYQISIVDSQGRVINDAGWKGWTWYILENGARTATQFPSSGDAVVTYIRSTSALTPNSYVSFDFVIGAFSGDTLAERVTVTSQPTLVSVSNQIASTFTFSTNFQVRFAQAVYSDIIDIAVFKSHILSKFSEALNAAEAYIENLELYQGSIVVEGTIKSTTSANALNAVQLLSTHIKQNSFGDSSLHGVNLRIVDNCDMTITDVRVVGQKTGGGTCVDTFIANIQSATQYPPSIPTSKKLEGWAIGLIVIGVLVLIGIVALISFKVMNKKRESNSSRPVTWRQHQTVDEDKLI